MGVPLPSTHRAVRLHPIDLTIHVEDIPTPKIEHPDDALVKVKLAGLCGSDLHGYRGHEVINKIIVVGHEFIGEIVSLGSSFSESISGRPPLYSTLRVGDQVVCPFNTSCGECHFCRIGFTCRCTSQILFGSEGLTGGQAQYVRVPKAGGALVVLESLLLPTFNDNSSTSHPDPSLLLLADILPTGVYTALQAVQHPYILPIIRGERFPLASTDVLTYPRITNTLGETTGVKALLSDPMWPTIKEEDRVLNIAIVGLGPVGTCATVALLDFLSALKIRLRLFAVDLLQARRENVRSMYDALPIEARGNSELIITSPDKAENLVMHATDGVGCNAVLEIVGHSDALTLAYTLLRPFGVIVSVGVHQDVPIPFTGREFYKKNISICFGRCPVRSIFPIAADLLRRRQDVFGGTVMGETKSIRGKAGVERVISINAATVAYEKFEKGEWGKVAFNPWI